MFVYNDDTPMDTRIHLGGNLFDSTVLMNEVYDGNWLTYCLTYGRSQWSMNVDKFSVMLPQLEMIGLRLIPCRFLWTFFHEVYSGGSL